LAYDMANMEIELTEKYLFRFYQLLANSESLEYRRTNPILVMLDYIPPHPSEIEEQMEIMFQWMNTYDFQSNPILRAAYLHNKLVEIYPYETHSEAVARMAMYYELIRNGFPPVLLNLSESEYYGAIRSYLKKEEIQPMYEPLERGVYNKLEIMMQLTCTT
ncbi:MAG TPA: Fic family protein, partial [Anaerovoracaceae bacterium]|nr:Fic family protein [Anaerovoracaceae bacterium]